MRRFFPKNIGTFGRIARGLGALVLLYFSYQTKSVILLLLSLFVFFEAFMSWCALNHMLGIDQSCKKKCNKQ